MEQAEYNLQQQTRNVVIPVPCPTCGHYQEDMVSILREDRKSNKTAIAGLIIAGLSFVALAFDVPYIWIVTVVGTLVGIALAAYGDGMALRFDPNLGDAEPRKAIGRQYAVWGEALDSMIAEGTQKVIANKPSSHNIKPA